MTTTIRAHFDGQYFVPDEPVQGLAPGTRVEVAPVSEKPIALSQREPAGSALRWLAENSIDDHRLPADLSHQHDHYLYGTPKQPD